MRTRTPLIAVSLAAACCAALATEFGDVISATAVTAQVAVRQQQCTQQEALVPQPTSGGGALLGALVGGVVGHTVGEGFGRAAATGLGVVAGSVIGDRTEAANTPPAAVPVQSCQTSAHYENRVVGYDVAYEYRGQRYTSRVVQDPGAHIALNVSVAPSDGAVAVAPTQVVPATVTSPVVVTTVPAYGYWGPGYYGYYGGPLAVAPHVGVVIGRSFHHRGY